MIFLSSRREALREVALCPKRAMRAVRLLCRTSCLVRLPSTRLPRTCIRALSLHALLGLGLGLGLGCRVRVQG